MSVTLLRKYSGKGRWHLGTAVLYQAPVKLVLFGFFFFFGFFLGPHFGHMEVPRVGVELALQLPPPP